MGVRSSSVSIKKECYNFLSSNLYFRNKRFQDKVIFSLTFLQYFKNTLPVSFTVMMYFIFIASLYAEELELPTFSM